MKMVAVFFSEALVITGNTELDHSPESSKFEIKLVVFTYSFKLKMYFQAMVEVQCLSHRNVNIASESFLVKKKGF
jgi:hypothetical protein